jgi:hypothetical protein
MLGFCGGGQPQQMRMRIFTLHCVFLRFFREERGEEGEWDEWEGGGRTEKRGPTFPLNVNNAMQFKNTQMHLLWLPTTGKSQQTQLGSAP